MIVPPIKMKRRGNETRDVVGPILQWLAARGFAVLTDKQVNGMTGFRYAAWAMECMGVDRGVVWRQNTGCAPMIGKGGKVRPVKFGQAGMADIIGVLRGTSGVASGRWLCIECKRPGVKLEAGSQQEAFRDVMLAYGAVYVLATTAEDVAQGLKKAGVI